MTLTGERLSRNPAFLQTAEEWEERNRVLVGSLMELINRFATFELGQGLDVGCQKGDLTDALASKTEQSWRGIDPILDAPAMSQNGADLLPGSAESIPFENDSFDCLILANVFEHIYPSNRIAALSEMRRVLRPGGVVVGQIPNPYFPIESHSRLPFMGWLPVGVQKRYWKLSPVAWEHDFYVVTPRTVAAEAAQASMRMTDRRNFNYPMEVIPSSLRPVAKVMERPMRRFPWAWQFVLEK
jgi:SAM-dependent methyltransferase